MAHRDIIVIGTSLGGFEALPRLVAGLPEELAAAVLIVQHIAPTSPSYLAERLSRAGPLRATPAIDGEPLEPGRIYVPLPDRHLMIDQGHVRLSRGPKESHARPSVDVLFRSAAVYGGQRVIGVVLTGQLDDGTAGLWAIKDRGGTTVVQSPADAEYPSMPASALEHVKVDYNLPIADIPNILRSLTRESIQVGEAQVNEKIALETQIALDGKALDRGVRSIGRQSFYTCPDCHGSMVMVEEGSIKRYRCHTGHGFSERALADQSRVKIEETLWAALAQMEERATLLRELADRADVPAQTASRYRAELKELQHMSRQVRELTQGTLFNPALEERRSEHQLS